jgi:CheY-like chemotaxis protein
VRLPCVTEPPATIRVASTCGAAATSPRRILVVDDNADAANALSELLTLRGHVVEVAHDGHEALRRARSFRPQAALLDIGMPGMDGYDLAGRLRADPLLADMLLVAITGWGQEEDRRRALAAGFDVHLTKPADPDTILALVAERVVRVTPSP